nr:uncharacterized protein LOC116428467 [Nomia melanderi]
MRQWFLVAVVASAIALIEGSEEIECPKNATRDEVTIPHETDCQKYYLCVGQEKVNMTCDQYKCFNPELRACDWPWMVPCCSTYMITSRPFTCRDKEPYDNDCQKYLQNGILKCCPEYHFYRIDTCTCEPVSEVPPGRCFPPPKGEPPCWTWTTTPETTTIDMCTDREVYERDCQKYLENGIRKCCPEDHFYSKDTCTCEPISEVPEGRCFPPPQGEPPCWTLSTTPETTTTDMCAVRQVYERDCQKYLENGIRKCCPEDHFYSTDTCTCEPISEVPEGRCFPPPKGEPPCWTLSTTTETTTIDMCADREVYERDCQKYLENGIRKCCLEDHFYSTDTCTCEPINEVPEGRCFPPPPGEPPCWTLSTTTETTTIDMCADREVYERDCQKYLENGIRKCCPEDHFYSKDTCTCEPISEVPEGRCFPPPHGEPPCWTLSTTTETTTTDMCAVRQVYERDCQKYLENGIRKCCADDRYYNIVTCTCDSQSQAPVGRCTSLPKGEKPCWQINDSTETTTIGVCTDKEVYENDCQKYLQGGIPKCCPDDRYYNIVTCTCDSQSEAPVEWFLVAVVATAIALIEGTEEIECPKNATRDEVTIPHETDCQKYYLCVGQEKVNMTCDQYKCFNPELGACDWPWMVPCCSTYVMTSRPFTCRDKEPYDNDCQKYLQNGILKCCPEYHFYRIDTCTCEPVSEVPPGRCSPPPHGEPPCWTLSTTPETTTIDMCPHREVYERDCQKYLENGERKCCPDEHFYSTDTCTCDPQNEAPVGRCTALPKGEEACWQINESMTTPSSTETTTVDMCADREVYERDCQKYLESGERKCCPDDHFYSTDTCTCEPEDEAPLGRCRALPKGEEPCWKINESITTPSSTETTTVDMCADREVYERDCQKYLEHGERKCCPDDHFYSNDTCTCEPNEEAPLGRCKALPKGEEPCWKINESITTPSSTETTTVDMCADREVYERDCQKYLEHGERKCCPDEHFYSNDTCTCEPEDQAPVGRCKALPKGERPCWEINDSTTIPAITVMSTTTVENKIPDASSSTTDVSSTTTGNSIADVSSTTTENSTADVSSTTTENSRADVSSTTTENSIADVSSTTTENNTPHASNLAMEYDEMVDDV